MRTLLLFPLLLMLLNPYQNPAAPADTSPVVVLGFTWSKSRQTIENVDSGVNVPAAAMIPANKNYERNRRVNALPGERDPNADTLDGRSAALERSVQESRTPKPVDGFTYRVKVTNASTKGIEILFWEYEFIDPSDPTSVSRRQFLCGVKIPPHKNKDVQAFTVAGPSDVITVSTLANKSGNPFQEKVLINRVEYADGTIWQRKDWMAKDVRLGYERALRTPWGSEMCRRL